jgi:hypothetical protein
VIISGRLRSDWKMVSSDAQAACEFVRSKPLLDCLYSRFSDCGYAADNPRAVPFAAVLSNPKSCNRRAGVAAGEPCGGRLVPAREHPSQKRIASVGRVFQRSRGLHGRPICSPQGQWARPCLTGSHRPAHHNPQIQDSVVQTVGKLQAKRFFTAISKGIDCHPFRHQRIIAPARGPLKGK